MQRWEYARIMTDRGDVSISYSHRDVPSRAWPRVINAMKDAGVFGYFSRRATVNLDGWKRLVDEATEHNGGSGPYIYVTGGEPLGLEAESQTYDELLERLTARLQPRP